MYDSDWLLHIFEVSDKPAQQRIIDVLIGAPSLAVHSASRDSDHYVFIDAKDEHCAHLARELVICADPNAVLVHISAKPTESGAHRGTAAARPPRMTHDDLVG